MFDIISRLCYNYSYKWGPASQTPKRVLTISPERHTMKRIIATVALLLSLFGFTACSAGSSTTSSSHKAYEVVEEFNGEVWTYACAAGYIPVDVAVGDITQRDGSSYSLKENKDATGEQVSVTLAIKLADNQEIPAIIVDNNYHSENSASGQGLYEPQLQNGSSLEVTLPREGFGGVGSRPITKVTACTKYLPTPASKG